MWVEAPSGPVTVMPVASTSVTLVPRRTSTPMAGEPPRGRRRPAAHRTTGSTVSTASTRMIRARVGSIRRKSFFRVRLASSAICPAISTPVGPAPTTTKVSARSASAGVLRQLGELEGAEDAAAQLEGVVDRLHAGRVAGELVVAEPRLPGAGGDEQAVVGRDALAAEHRRGDGARLEVDVGDGAEHDPGVLLAGEHLARARGDLALGEDARRHLVEQRLEEVVRGRGDEGDLDVLAALERLRAEEASEARTDDDDSVGGGHVRSNAGGPHGMPPAQGRGRGHHRGSERRAGRPRPDGLTRCG